MTTAEENRFQDFFEDDQYVVLKNHLYNYLLRKRAVERVMQHEHKGVVLEIGSGLSPVLTSWEQVVYSDLSFSGLSALRRSHAKGHYVVADGMSLPFKANAFTHAISSEVLEHLIDDRQSLKEMARVIGPDGSLVVTFPHRRCYYAHDDRFVKHHRRYELSEIYSLMKEAGLEPVYVRKVLGPLEKATMLLVTACLSLLQKKNGEGDARSGQQKPGRIMIGLFKWANRLYAGLVRLDAFVMPRAWSAVLLVKALKHGKRR